MNTSRVESVRRNDAKIRAVLIDLITKNGWDSVTISAVAKRAGVTVGAVYTRAENLAELANNAWVETLGPLIEEFIDSAAVAAVSSSAESIRQTSALADSKSVELSAALDLIIASVFDDELAEVVGANFRELLRRRINPQGTSLMERHQSAAVFLALAFLLGRVLAQFSGGSLDPLPPAEAQVLADFAGAAPELTSDLPLPELFFLQEAVEDSALKRAVLTVLARWGYRKGTVSRMARAVSMSPGALIAHAGSKSALVADAADSLLRSPLQVWQPFLDVIPEHSSAEVRAGFLHEYLDPANVEYWKLNLELARAARAHHELRAFRVPADSLNRTHLAVMLLALFIPGARDLPFQGCFRMGATT